MAAAPAPGVDPAYPLLVFDGVCVLCSATFRFVLEHDRRQRFRFALAQSPLGQSLYRHYRLDPHDLQTVLLIADGRLHTDAAAVTAVLRRLPWPWPVLAAAAILPRALARRTYAVVARNRYRWFGQIETCLVPGPELRARFAPGGWQ